MSEIPKEKSLSEFLCVYCNITYDSKKELSIHEYFHNDQSVSALMSTGELSNGYIPFAKKLSLDTSGMRMKELSKRRIERSAAIKRKREMSEEIDDLVYLTMKYPMKRRLLYDEMISNSKNCLNDTQNNAKPATMNDSNSCCQEVSSPDSGYSSSPQTDILGNLQSNYNKQDDSLRPHKKSVGIKALKIPNFSLIDKSKGNILPCSPQHMALPGSLAFPNLLTQQRAINCH